MEKRKIVGCSFSHNAGDHGQPAAYKLLNWAKVTPDKDGIIYWHIANFTPDMDKFKTLFAFQTCFNKWQAAFDGIAPVGRVIEFKPTDDWHQANIRLYFINPGLRSQKVTISDGTEKTIINKWPFDGEQGVLAHRQPNSFDLLFDEGEQWSDIHKFEKVGNNYVLFVQLWQVAMHELGHMLDIDHATDKKAIMYPTYDGEHITIEQDDMNALSAAFGKMKADIHAKKGTVIPQEPVKPGSVICPDFPIEHVQEKLPRHATKKYKKRELSAITQIILHHSADNGTPTSIAKYHVSHHGWAGVGYHFLIDKAGKIFQGNDIDTVSNHLANQNTKSLGICLIGNFEKVAPPEIQVKALKSLLVSVRTVVGALPLYGHRDKGQSLCPGKNLYALLKSKDVS